MGGGFDDGFSDGVVGIGAINVPPEMVDKVVAVQAADRASGIADKAVTDDVARQLEAGEFLEKP